MSDKMKKLVFLIFLLLCRPSLIFAEIKENNNVVRILQIEEFIKNAVENDTVFEQILIDELALKYSRDLKLPAKDLILSIKGQYEFTLNQDINDSEAAITLSKLFPYTGTNISAEYKTSPSISLDENNSEITLLISQPIAKNAFGNATRLQDKIIGAEIDVTKYQIIEAYEDYMATIMMAYYNWYSAYENLKIGESSYQQNLKLLENIKKRKINKIALPIDVNKVNIQALTKKENLFKLQEKYESILNFIKQTIRYKESDILEPADPFTYDNREILFEDDYGKFVQNSRTYKTLNLLEEKSSLEVKKDANDLLPSTNLLFGYTMEGKEVSINDEDNLVFAGFSVHWPFPSQVERAKYKTSKIENRKIQISNKNKYIQLYTDLRNLFIQIEREKRLISLAEEKIVLAESILKDETKNYSYGKVSLNDFIDAVNRVDENRFNMILHAVQLKILMTEWLRITDQLILRKEIKKILE